MIGKDIRIDKNKKGKQRTTERNCKDIKKETKQGHQKEVNKGSQKKPKSVKQKENRTTKKKAQWKPHKTTTRNPKRKLQ